MNFSKTYKIPLIWGFGAYLVLLASFFVHLSRPALTYSRYNLSASASDAIVTDTFTQFPIASTTTTPQPIPPFINYIEIVDSCDWEYVGACVNMRSGSSLDAPVILRLRKGIVLKVKDIVLVNGITWYKIAIDPFILHPERVTSDWYVSALNVKPINSEADELLTSHKSSATSKYIIVDISQEMLYAYDGDTLFMKEAISTGLDSSPTPSGTYEVFKKTPSRYMQGPTPGTDGQSFDLPGVPWDLYFTSVGDVIHGAYWHNNFGKKWSHGCVNLPYEKSKELYEWAPIGILVTVRD